MNYKVLELFAGAGGMALGLENAGFSPTALIDIDKFACKTLKENRPHWNVIEGDINTIAEEGIDNFVDTKDIDLISGGFPCQPFSYAGKSLGLEDVRGTVFHSLAQIIKDVQPKMFLAENVRGLISHDKGKTFETVISILSDIGYDVQWEILNAWDYGVAQKRQRVIIVGTRKDLDISFEYPEPNDYKPVLRDVIKDVPDSVGSKYPEKKKKVLELVPPGGCWRDLPDEIAKEYMMKSYYLGGGRTGMARRISWDEPSLTLTCSPAQKQTERCHPDETRPFTTREYARIQSFPDEWEFIGSVTNIYKQIGNAVPVGLSTKIGESIFKSLSNYREGNQ